MRSIRLWLSFREWQVKQKFRQNSFLSFFLFFLFFIFFVIRCQKQKEESKYRRRVSLFLSLCLLRFLPSFLFLFFCSLLLIKTSLFLDEIYNYGFMHFNGNFSVNRVHQRRLNFCTLQAILRHNKEDLKANFELGCFYVAMAEPHIISAGSR